MRIDCWIGCILVLATSSFAAASNETTVPDGIGAGAWAQIQQQIGAARFTAEATED